MTDTRTWMYRAGEARCFDGRDLVPDGGGWVDSPVRIATAPGSTSPHTGAATTVHARKSGAKPVRLTTKAKRRGRHGA